MPSLLHANGAAERSVQTLKALLIKQVLGKDLLTARVSLQHHLANFLLQKYTTLSDWMYTSWAVSETPAENLLYPPQVWLCQVYGRKTRQTESSPWDSFIYLESPDWWSLLKGKGKVDQSLSGETTYAQWLSWCMMVSETTLGTLTTCCHGESPQTVWFHIYY